jgi:tRNA(fMet)-specific endonuclease VapC
MDYHLDTNICSAVMKAVPTATYRARRRAGQLAVSTVVLGELYAGCYRSTRVEENLTALAAFIESVEVIPFDERAAREYGLIYAELMAKGRPTGEKDGLIAAVARVHQAIMVTNNRRHFENITGLLIEDWLAPLDPSESQ